MPKLELNPDAVAVQKVYPFVFRTSDRHGYFIMSLDAEGTGRTEVGAGKSPEKAWRDAAKRIEDAKKPPRQKTPRNKRKVKNES